MLQPLASSRKVLIDLLLVSKVVPEFLAFYKIRKFITIYITYITYFMLQHFFKNKNISKKLKLILKNTIIDKTLTYALETSTVTKRDRKQLNIFERKVYRRILGPVYDKRKENWRILTNEEIYANIKKPTITETIKLHRLRWFGHVQRMEENRISKRVLCMNLETIRPRGRP